MGEQPPLAYYRRLPYARRVQPREDSNGRVHFLAWIDEIPWIEIHGETREQALLKLDEIFADCIQSMLDAGDVPPEPVRWPQNIGGPFPAARRREGVTSTQTSTETRPQSAAIVTPVQVHELPHWKLAEDFGVETATVGATS